ncbi:DUF4177 domain-containing protein [Anaeromyxobacter sp. SG66]|uniref:DUF4177 domain-containing protein n=1 Tax=Anaeromyxobacter sp. SG66 TaxID=2925410 RepID=UPI001F5601DA|nr:DUF4177 domain-containing protein [Anaeromyxobacter sp. SG66]
MTDAETAEQRKKYQQQADQTRKEVWWRGEKFVPCPLPGILKYGDKCPFCGATQEYETNKRCAKCRAEFTEPPPPAGQPEPVVLPPGTKMYKVITQRDEFFGGKFDPNRLEELINMHAVEGWRVVSIATADVSTFFGSFWSGRGARQEIIVFLERDAA